MAISKSWTAEIPATNIELYRQVRLGVLGACGVPKEYQQHDICLMSVGELMTEIRSYIESDWWPPTQRAIRQYPILRGIQETLRYTGNRR